MEVPNIKFHGNASNGYRADAADRQMDDYEEGNLGAFRDYANARSIKRTESYVKILLLNLQQIFTVIILSLNKQPRFSYLFVKNFFCVKQCISYLEFLLVHHMKK